MCLAKGLAILALILIILGWAVYGYCYTLEMDYSGPGSEYEASMERYRDESNRESAERCGRGEASDRDQERAEQYQKDHGV